MFRRRTPPPATHFRAGVLPLATAFTWRPDEKLLPPLAGLLVATALPAQSPPSDITLWVTLGDSDQLVEVDPYSYRELRRIKVGHS